MTRSGLHEAAEDLREETREMHRAIVSLIEELEAVDWYAQRVDASSDAALREVLAHNLEEEKEHACMTLEWIRRHDPDFDALLRRLLFRDGESIVLEESGSHAGDPGEDAASRATPRATDHGLGIGSLRGRTLEAERIPGGERDAGKERGAGARMEKEGSE